MLALLFPGQGSQEVGMGRDVHEAYAVARDVFAEADEALGFPLSKLCFEGPEDELRRTEMQQPAILTTSVALLRVLEESCDPRPAFVGGHSLGEYTALVAAGAIPFADAVRTVHARGRFMQQAVPEGQGAMAAIMGCAPEVVAQACSEAAAESGHVVAPANYNSPQQTVIAGTTAAVEAACERARALGAKRAVPLSVSAPFHCELMAPAADALAAVLADLSFATPSPPVVTNVDAQPNADAARIPDLLVRQVTAAVRFSEMVETLGALSVTHFLEVGPGRVLSGLLARIERRSQRANFAALEDLAGASAFVAAA